MNLRNAKKAVPSSNTKSLYFSVLIVTSNSKNFGRFVATARYYLKLEKFRQVRCHTEQGEEHNPGGQAQSGGKANEGKKNQTRFFQQFFNRPGVKLFYKVCCD